jgi:hypothetical protein
MQNL